MRLFPLALLGVWTQQLRKMQLISDKQVVVAGKRAEPTPCPTRPYPPLHPPYTAPKPPLHHPLHPLHPPTLACPCLPLPASA